MSQEENYKVKERSIAAVVKHGSVEKAINFLKAEIEGMEVSWGKYSCDCLGHGITCVRLMLRELTGKTQS